MYVVIREKNYVLCEFVFVYKILINIVVKQLVVSYLNEKKKTINNVFVEILQIMLKTTIINNSVFLMLPKVLYINM